MNGRYRFDCFALNSHQAGDQEVDAIPTFETDAFCIPVAVVARAEMGSGEPLILEPNIHDKQIQASRTKVTVDFDCSTNHFPCELIYTCRHGNLLRAYSAHSASQRLTSG